MSAEPGDNGVAADELRVFVDRILRLREEVDERQADVRDVYAEAKGRCFDKTALGALVAEIRKRAKDPSAADERDAILELYREAYHNAASHTHAREAA